MSIESITINCVILAGFVGLTQDEKTASIKPEIGWFIKRNESLDNIFAFRNDSDDSYSKSDSDDINYLYRKKHIKMKILTKSFNKCCQLFYT